MTLLQNLHPIFPGCINGAGRPRYSGLREHAREPRRGATAAFRRSARKAYRTVFSHVEVRTDADGVRHRDRKWHLGRPSLKAWLRAGAP